MRKSVKVLMILSLIATILAFGFFAAGPLIMQLNGGTGYYYVDRIFYSLVCSFPTIFSLSNLRSIVACISFIFLVAIWIIWLIVTIAKKKVHSVAPMIVGFFVYFAIFVLVDALIFDTFDTKIIDPDVTHNGKSLLEYFISVMFNPENILMVAFGFIALGLIGLAFVLTFVENIVDVCTPKNYLAKEGQSIDDEAKAAAIASSKDVLKLLEEPVADESRANVDSKESASSAQASSTRPFIFQQFFNGATPEQSSGLIEKKDELKSEPMQSSTISHHEEEIRKFIREEIKSATLNDNIKTILHGELPTGHGNEIRAIVHDELSKVINDDVLNRIIAYIRVIVQEELNKVIFKQVDEVKPEPVPAVEEPKEEVTPEPTPVEEVKEEVTPEPAPVEEPKEEIAPEPTPVVEEAKPKIIRIPFTDRCKVMVPEMRAHFNELKSEIMAYGVHSRVSNSGDTFRLHTKTYVKMTIAGNSLKLYFALDPKKYADTTLPISDAGHKGIYKEIPLVFKVKSELSLRRAKQLIADVMAIDNLSQKEVETKDWIQEIIDSNTSD